jgi:phage-related protein (TIGR01555 family)
VKKPVSSEAKSFKSKKDRIAHLLLNGTTVADILKATSWPSVSVPAQAKAAGLKLEKYKEGGVTKYKGIPMTDAEKKAAMSVRKPEKRSAGVVRHVIGTDRVSTKRAAKVAAKAEPAKPAAVAAVADVAPKTMKITDTVLRAAQAMSRKLARKQAPPEFSPFQPYQPPPGVLPKGAPAIAMDEAIGGMDFNQLNNWAFGAGIFGSLFEEGIGFLGYSYLAQLTQRPEYRRISERIATEMTRKWIELQVITSPELDKPVKKPDEAAPADGDVEPEDTPENAAAAQAAKNNTIRLKQLEDELKRLKVRDAFYNVAEQDGWFGRAHLYIDLGPEDDKEDATSIGNGHNEESKVKVKKNKLKAIRNVEPMWCYPSVYEAKDPRRGSFYNPSVWYVNGVAVHASRLLTFVGREVPDILKPAYAFGGLSMSQIAKPYVDNWLRTRQAVADLIESFSVSGVYTNMTGALQDGGVEAIRRIEMFNTMRANSGSFALDKETEEFFNVSTPLGTLDALQAQSQEQMASISGLPIIILLGITPQGLNASSEGEMRAFYDWINAYQESLFRDHLQTVIEFAQRNIWGKVDKNITFVFKPLWSMTEKEEAEIDKFEGEADQIRIDSGVLHPEEARKALAAKPGSRYSDINIEDVPKPPADPTGSGMDDEDHSDGGNADAGENDDSASEGGGAEDEAALPFVSSDIAVDNLERLLSADASFNESDHPRATDGKFGSGGGSSKAKPSKLTPTEKAYLDSYSGDEFLKLNAGLRSGKVDGPAVAKIDTAIGKSTVPPGTILYRGISKDALKKLINGDTIEKGQVLSDPAFLSASADRNIAGLNSIGGVVMEIEVGQGQKGLDMSQISRNKHEKEVILPRNSKMKILGIRAPKKPGDPIIVRVATHNEEEG